MKRITAYTAVLAGMLSAGGCAPNGQAGGGERLFARPEFRAVVREAKAKVFPSVVYIKCLRESRETGKKITEEMAGSGVLISPAGEVMSNWHVVDKAVEVRCLLYDGRAMDAKVVGKDKDTDLALLQLKLSRDTGPLPCAKFGDSDKLREGDFVMAMGAPWGLNRSVSIGIISCTRRYLPKHSEYSLWLQTDASISPGSSGGPLVNTEGLLVGINTRGAFGGGDMGFSVPSNTVRFIADQLREHGKVDWSWTGLQLQALKDFNRNIYFEGDEGVVISATDPASPAMRAGIRLKDRILKVNGVPINAEREEDLPSARRLLGLLEKGKPAELEIRRDNKVLKVAITPREKGKVEGDELDCPRWDMTVKTINQFDNPDLYFHRKKGVYVFGVKYPGNASSAGFGQKDIILKIDGKNVATLEDMKKIHKAAIDNVKTRHRILFVLLRGGLLRQVVLDFSRDYERE